VGSVDILTGARPGNFVRPATPMVIWTVLL